MVTGWGGPWVHAACFWTRTSDPQLEAGKEMACLVVLVVPLKMVRPEVLVEGACEEHVRDRG